MNSSATRTLHKTYDYVYSFQGIWRDGGRCRIRIYDDGQHIPVVVSEFPDNPTTLVSTMAEYLAAEIIHSHFCERVELNPSFLWIEHYNHGLMGRPGPHFSQATFQHYRPTRTTLGATERDRIGKPTWQLIDVELVVQLTGDEELRHVVETADLARTSPCGVTRGDQDIEVTRLVEEGISLQFLRQRSTISTESREDSLRLRYSEAAADVAEI